MTPRDPHSIGHDANGDDHLVNDDSGLHESSPLCGCNPDPYHDEKLGWWWGHHILRPYGEEE